MGRGRGLEPQACRASGHWYFSLKDDNAQIRAVVWKSAARLIKFKPQDGMKVLARGARAASTPPRGEYQLSVEVLEPLGKGSLQQAFEELKERLEKEGLFAAGPQAAAARAAAAHRHRDLAHGRGDPGHPARPGAAATRTSRSLIYPARVQGPEAAAEIVPGHPRPEPRAAAST